MEYDNFCDFEVSHKQDWKIEVRLERRWEEIDMENGQVRSIHLVFIDASNVQPISAVTQGLNKEHRFIKFEVTDLIHTVKVCFLDAFAANFENEYNEQIEHPVIVVISSCRMIRNNYTGLTTVRNESATSFETNANVERVQTLRNRFWEVHGI
ncbi:hypothetical protein POM88_000928 [Heracleum sosnowskyi]|uniref:DUF223 domain-containing protein n=1 Tax=Heracleum sosnowskyi TaxID=360622 RepID=A0AAD8JDY0_9APIA|nr:hypothetical protein POM88_000928 [Heracleum sosnowskyi]